jgi:phage tail protein, P2 protein I family
MDLSNVDLLSLQSSYMQKDPTTIALCAALTPQFRQLATETKLCIIYARISELDDAVLDELAWQMHVDWYDSTLDIEIKRNLIKNSIRFHQIKGTPTAVEVVASTVFGRSWVEEWFEYGGDPYYFRVNVEASHQGASQSDLIKLENLINQYKNTRSWLEIINIFLTSNSILYVAAAMTTGESITVYPWNVTEVDSNGQMIIGVGYQAVETITVYPL